MRGRRLMIRESGRILWHSRDKLMPRWTNLGFACLLPRRSLDSTRTVAERQRSCSALASLVAGPLLAPRATRSATFYWRRPLRAQDLLVSAAAPSHLDRMTRPQAAFRGPDPAAASAPAPRREFLPFAPPLIGEEEIQEVVDTLRSSWITTGPKTNRFEQDFATYLGAPGALALNSCTAALHTGLA